MLTIGFRRHGGGRRRHGRRPLREVRLDELDGVLAVEGGAMGGARVGALGRGGGGVVGGTVAADVGERGAVATDGVGGGGGGPASGIEVGGVVGVCQWQGGHGTIGSGRCSCCRDTCGISRGIEDVGGLRVAWGERG